MTLEEAIAVALDLDRRGRALNAAIGELRQRHNAQPGHPLDNAWRLTGSTQWKRAAGELREAQREMEHERPA